MSYILVSSTNRTQCISEVAVVISPIYKGVIAGELLASCLALCPNLALMWVIWRVTVFPVNLRLLLSQFSFLLSWLALGNVIKSTYLLQTTPCTFNIGQRACKIFDLLVSTLPLATVNYTLMALCIERLLATVIYKHYDRVAWHTRPYLACMLILVSQLIAILVNGLGLPQLATDTLMPLCESHFMPSTSPPYLVQIYLGCECVSAALVIFIYTYNRLVARSMAINRARYNLAARFMIDQNVQINAIVAPTMILHFLAHIPAYTIGNIQKTWDLDLTTRSWMARLTVLLRLIYAFMHPLLAFHFNAHFRKQLLEHSPVGHLLRRLGVRGTSMKIQENVDEARTGRHANNLVVHFDHLDKIWTLTKPLTKVVHGAPKTAWNDPEPVITQKQAAVSAAPITKQIKSKGG